MKRLLFAALLVGAGISQIDTASAQYYGSDQGYGYPPGRPVYREREPTYGGPAYGGYRKPMGWGEPYQPTYQYDGRIGCVHRNYRVIDGWCQRAW